MERVALNALTHAGSPNSALGAMRSTPQSKNLSRLISATIRLFRFLIVTGFAWLSDQTLRAKPTVTIRLRIAIAGGELLNRVYFSRMSRKGSFRLAKGEIGLQIGPLRNSQTTPPT